MESRPKRVLRTKQQDMTLEINVMQPLGVKHVHREKAVKHKYHIKCGM